MTAQTRNEVFSALERTSRSDSARSQPGYSALDTPRDKRQSRSDTKAASGTTLKSLLLDPLEQIKAVMKDLSPSGLKARGIPFSDALKMPRSVLFGSILINLFGLALPLVVLQAYDRIIPNLALETFQIMMLGLCGVITAEALLRIARSYIVAWSATRFTRAITQDLIGRYLYAPSGKFTDTIPAKTIERLGHINRIADFYGGPSRMIFIDLPFGLLFLAVLALIGGWLVLVPFAILCFFGFATIASSRQYRNLLEKKEEHEARTYDFVAETLNGILTMKGAGAEPLLMRRFERLQSANARLHYSLISSSMHTQMIAGVLGNGTMIAMVTTGAVFAVFDQISIGVLAACSLLSGRAVQPILRVAGTWNEFQSARLAVQEIGDLFEIGEAPTGAVENDEPAPARVLVKDLCITAKANETILENISFTLEPGQVLAVVAKDGSGKSSLLKKISGLVPSDHGQVYLDHLPAYEYRKKNSRSVGYIEAGTEVFVGSIYDNLSLFGQGTTPENVRWAAKLLQIEAEIDKLPDGYNTKLGRGISETLHTGLVKRIVQARSLAQKPALWVLDEPQGELDETGIHAFMNAIDELRGKVSVVYSTHSDRLIRKADRIIHIADGRYQIFDDHDVYLQFKSHVPEFETSPPVPRERVDATGQE